MNLPEFTLIYLNIHEFTWIYLNLPEFTWMGSFWFTWVHLDSLGFIWVHLCSLGFTWDHLGSLGFTWIHLSSLGFTWVHLGFLDSLGWIWETWNKMGHIRGTRKPQTDRHTHTHGGFLRCTEILSGLSYKHLCHSFIHSLTDWVTL